MPVGIGIGDALGDVEALEELSWLLKEEEEAVTEEELKYPRGSGLGNEDEEPSSRLLVVFA